MTSTSLTHEGLERVLEGTRTLSEAVGPSRSLRAAPLIVLTGIVTAVLASAERLFGDVLSDGFTGEWLALWAMGVVVALVFARTATWIAAGLVRALNRAGEQHDEARNDRAFLELARLDPRIMSDLRAAQARANIG